MERPVVLLAFTGVLLDETGEDKALDAAMRRVASRFDIPVSPRELSGGFRLGLMEVMQGEPDVEEPAAFVPYPEAVRSVFADLMAGLGIEVNKAEEDWFQGEYRQARRRHAKLFPDGRRAVARFKQAGHRLAVVTDADDTFVEDSLDGSRLASILDVRATAAEAGHVKPHPGVFALALDRLAASPEEAVMVGSSYERDLVGAKRAGVRRGVLVDRHDARTVDVPRAKSMRAASRIVSRWERRATKWD